MNSESSQAIVMIHGMFTNMSVFYFHIAQQLAQHFHIVLYDLPSHGMSERADSGYDLTSMSNDLISLLEKLKLDKVHLVGYSYGGLIALKTAMLYPERVDKLTIIEAPKPDGGDAPEVLKQFGDQFIDNYLDNYQSSTALRPGKRQIEKNKNLFEYLFNHTSIKEDFDKDNDLFDILGQKPIKHRTLLLYGTNSDCLPAGKYLKDIIPNSIIDDIEGDHNLPIQHPDWISDKLIDFIK